MTGILQARGLTKTFQMGEARFNVLKELDFDLQPGEFVAIEGRSGSGKSTMMHILAALDSADDGVCIFDGTDYTCRTPRPIPRWIRLLTYEFLGPDPEEAALTSLIWIVLFLAALVGVLATTGSPDGSFQQKIFYASIAVAGVVVLLQLIRFTANLWSIFSRLRDEGPASRLRNRQFGFVFQFYHLLPELNVLENTMLAPSIQFSWLGFAMQREKLRQRATELLEQLGLGHRLTHRSTQLSGGERQRVAIARALMNSPKVLFADEPTGNLDAETGRQIMDVLEKLHREQGQTIVMVTHDRSLAREADRVLVLRDGKLEPAVGNSNDEIRMTNQ
jgi:ABC-type lipoprotein export system ATPase subunit